MEDCNVWIWRDDLKGDTEEENVQDSIVDVVKEIVSGAGKKMAGHKCLQCQTCDTNDSVCPIFNLRLNN